MPDGKIVFSTALDNKGLEQELAGLKKKIQRLEDQLDTNKKMKSPLVEQSKQLAAALDIAKAKLHEMKTAANGAFSMEQISDQDENVKMLQSQWNKVQGQVEAYDKKIEKATIELEKNKEQAGEIAQQLSQVSPAYKKMSEAMAKAEKNAQRFSLRMKEVLRSALIFTLISQGMAQLREWIGKVIRSNDEASASIARLKGALLTLAQPLVDILIPALVTLTNLLTAVAGRAAQLISALFGSTADQSAKAAESLYAEVDALEETGSAAKKAGKNLASFDEVNKLSNNQNSGGGGAGNTEAIDPDFSWADSISETLSRIADAVLLIGAGFALWKVSESLPGMLGTVAAKLAGLMVAIGGVMLFYEGLTDAWENGIDWSNMALMIGGTALAAAGLYKAFGNIGAGIALVVGGIGMLVTGFRDVIMNGATLQNVLTIIAGIISAGLGISLLTGSVLPLLISGIAAVLTAFVAWQGNMEEFAQAFQVIFNGIRDFFVGVFTGDMAMALNGLQNVFRGAINAVIIVFESLVNAIVDGLNWIISKANGLGAAVGLNALIPTIPKVKLPRVPYLAQGAVIPPNREFLAVLGDQKNGTNIETPLSTMIEAFKVAMRDMNMGGGGNHTAVLEIDKQQFAKIVYTMNQYEAPRVGVNLVER